jgi:hypothetical protein
MPDGSALEMGDGGDAVTSKAARRRFRKAERLRARALVDPAAFIDAGSRAGAMIAVRDDPLVGLETLGFRAVEGWATVTALGALLLHFGMLVLFARPSRGRLDVARGRNRAGTRSAAAVANLRLMLGLTGAVVMGALVYGATALLELVVS